MTAQHRAATMVAMNANQLLAAGTGTAPGNHPHIPVLILGLVVLFALGYRALRPPPPAPPPPPPPPPQTQARAPQARAAQARAAPRRARRQAPGKRLGGRDPRPDQAV